MNKRHGTHVILKSIAPAQEFASSDQLVYPNLVSSREYFQYPSLLIKNGSALLKSWKSYKTSVVHEEFQVATLMMAAHRLQQAWLPHTKLFWSAQLTSRSVALFGQPMGREVSRLAVKELQMFESIATEFEDKQEFFEPLLKSYQSLIKRKTKSSKSVEDRYQTVLTSVRDYFLQEYADELACFDRYAADASVSPAELVKPYRAALELLALRDPAWKMWRVVSDDSAKLHVEVPRKRIVIGKQRAPLAIDELKGLFAHEVLVHAQRAMRGEKISKQFSVGLPGYLTAEEGLGVLVESAINGKISRKVKDRYVDISLALGDTMRRPLSRQELYEVCYVREVTRSLVRNDDTSLNRIEKEVWEHVNRIYRGSLGNKYIAVFTKDVAYYKGFVRMARYIKKQLVDKNMGDIFSYLLSGKFDPNIPEHASKVKHHIDNNRQNMI